MAQTRCRALGGNLATIDSAAATQCLKDDVGKAAQKATSAWIGLVDTKANSKHTANSPSWKWRDNSPYNYENFAAREPNNLGGEGKEWCTEVYLPASTKRPAGTWNDKGCNYTIPALCSVPAKGTHGMHRPTVVPSHAAGRR
ncbi:Lectin precursor [Aphelenchoides avenae]|nr:Lectin precursor [Aphelenchus avenae]